MPAPWLEPHIKDVRELVAMAAHACWCEQMIRDGWSVGESFDEHLKQHDALTSFESLTPRDRRAAFFLIEAEELEARLAEAIEYERGPAREFLLEDMRVGIRVGWNPDAFDEIDEIDLEELGVIVNWEVESDGIELRTFDVRWDRGDTSTHFPCERGLRRADPADP